MTLPVGLFRCRFIDVRDLASPSPSIVPGTLRMAYFLIRQTVLAQKTLLECDEGPYADVRPDLCHKLQHEVQIVNRGEMQPQRFTCLV